MCTVEITRSQCSISVMYKATSFLLLCILDSYLVATFRCPSSNLQDGQGKVKLTAISFEGGFTAKWETIDTNYVDLVNLEWICYSNGTEPKGDDTTVLLQLSEWTSGSANVTLDNATSAVMECNLFGCYYDYEWGDLHSITAVVFLLNFEEQTVPSSSLLPSYSSDFFTHPTSTQPLSSTCICTPNSDHSKRSIDDDVAVAAKQNDHYIIDCVMVSLLSSALVLIVLANISLMILVMKFKQVTSSCIVNKL